MTDTVQDRKFPNLEFVPLKSGFLSWLFIKFDFAVMVLFFFFFLFVF